MKASTGSGGKTCLYIGALADSYANGTVCVCPSDHKVQLIHATRQCAHVCICVHMYIVTPETNCTNTAALSQCHVHAQSGTNIYNIYSRPHTEEPMCAGVDHWSVHLWERLYTCVRT